ncbi:MAG: hypothetical protein Q6360_15935, partial [Candidatus Brocadiales bacterium]|nr:hypothetical protein [Candidatus Brocadiales bacterium]
MSSVKKKKDNVYVPLESEVEAGPDLAAIVAALAVKVDHIGDTLQAFIEHSHRNFGAANVSCASSA